MKGGISLTEFITQVKAELLQAQDKSENAAFELRELTLEVSFFLETKGKAGMKFVVVEFGTAAKAQQTHKVIVALTPIRPKAPPGGQSRIGFPEKKIDVVGGDPRITFEDE
jgi:hypothetical protein